MEGVGAGVIDGMARHAAGTARAAPTSASRGAAAHVHNGQKVLSGGHGMLSAADAASVTAAIAKEHRKPRTRQPQARGQGEREEFCVESELDALIPLLPTETRAHALASER